MLTWSRHCISRNNCHISQFFALCPRPKWSNWSDNFLSMIFGILGKIGIEIVEHIFYIKIIFDRKNSSKNKKCDFFYLEIFFDRKKFSSKKQKTNLRKINFKNENFEISIFFGNFFEKLFFVFRWKMFSMKNLFDIKNVLNYFDPNFPQDSKNHT